MHKVIFKKYIPNLLTLANLFCGLLIIISASQRQFDDVIYWAAASLFFDFLDGTMARILNVTSQLGKELDSLADIVSFGAAPSAVLYFFWSTDSAWAYSSLIIALFAAYRLAKFNTSVQHTDFFIGLPTPAFAIICFILPKIQTNFMGLRYVLLEPFFMVAFSIIGGLLLIGNYKLFSLKLGSTNKALNQIRLVFLALCVVLIVWLHFFGIFLCLVAYLGLSLSSQKNIQ